MRNTEVVYIGIDVSKETLDIDAGDFGVMKIENSPAQVRKALMAVARKAHGNPLHVCFESTGSYHGTLAAECPVMGIAYSILNPWKVACFAKSIAHAKTDALDASLIRRYAQVRRPAPTPPPRKALADLDEHLLARESITKSTVALRCVLATIKTPAAGKPLKRVIASNEKKIAEYDRLIAEAVKADAEVAGLADALASVKGIGELTAAKLVAWMPELGTLGKRKVAALAGLAPHTRESGKWKGKSRTGGGRRHVRTALYMCAVSAMSANPEMKAFYQRLVARGVVKMVALTATIRRLLCYLESVAKNYYAQHKDVPA